MKMLRNACLAAIVLSSLVLGACDGGASSPQSRSSVSAKSVTQFGDVEPNNTKESAGLLPTDYAGFMHSTSTVDDDWFRITPEASALVLLNLNFDDTQGDLDFSVHRVVSTDENGIITSEEVLVYEGDGASRQLLFVAQDQQSDYLVHIVANFVDGASELVPNPPISYDFAATCQVRDLVGSPLLSPIGNRFRAPGVDLSFTLVGASADPSAALVYSMEGLPTGSSFDESTGVFAWTPQAGDVGDHEILARFTYCGQTVERRAGSRKKNPKNPADTQYVYCK